MAHKAIYQDNKHGLAGIHLASEGGTAVQIAAEDGGRIGVNGSYVALFPKGDLTPFAFFADGIEGGLHIQYRGSDGEMKQIDLIKAVEALAKLVD